MSTEIVKAEHVKAVAAPLEFTQEQRRMILTSFLNGASEQEAAVLMELARVRRLNPITRQIHFVKRWDSQKRAEVWSAQVGIDGFRAIAERTGLYDGQDEPEFEYDAKGELRLTRVRVYRKDWGRPAVGVAHFDEYAQRRGDGSLTKMWAEKPHIMLAKCAEALAFRKAFPEDTSGLYAPEEMQADQERETNEAPRRAPAVEVLPPESGTRTAPVQASAKTAKEPEQPKTAAASRARAARIWAQAKAKGLGNKEVFAAFCKKTLGADSESKNWTEAEMMLLEGALSAHEVDVPF